MKKLFWIILIALLIPNIALAIEGTANLTWKQKPYLGLAGWGIYYSFTKGGPYTKIADVPYTAEQASYSTSQKLEVPEGAKTTVYVVIDSYNKSGVRSAYSGEYSFVADASYPVPESPTELVITFTLQVVSK